jgi:hypothetical protein
LDRWRERVLKFYFKLLKIEPEIQLFFAISIGDFAAAITRLTEGAVNEWVVV